MFCALRACLPAYQLGYSFGVSVSFVLSCSRRPLCVLFSLLMSSAFSTLLHPRLRPMFPLSKNGEFFPSALCRLSLRASSSHVVSSCCCPRSSAPLHDNPMLLCVLFYTFALIPVPVHMALFLDPSLGCMRSTEEYNSSDNNGNDDDDDVEDDATITDQLTALPPAAYLMSLQRSTKSCLCVVPLKPRTVNHCCPATSRSLAHLRLHRERKHYRYDLTRLATTFFLKLSVGPVL